MLLLNSVRYTVTDSLVALLADPFVDWISTSRLLSSHKIAPLF
jgi:hypothetical protein